MAPPNTVNERLASLEANLRHISENAERQREDLLDRLNAGNDALRQQIAELRAIVIEQNNAAKVATDAAVASASKANASIAEFSNKMQGAKLLVVGAFFVVGALGGFVAKLATALWPHP